MLTILGRHFATGELRSFYLDEGRIQAVQPPEHARPAIGDEEVWVAPGLVDIQINGYHGYDLCRPDVSVEDVVRMAEELAPAGTTAFCATVTTAAFDSMLASVRAIAAACESNATARERIIGIHLEGPYVSPDDGPRGAHPARHVRRPDWGEFTRLQSAAGGRIRMVTLAPEMEGAPEFIAQACRSGLVVALGHHQASREQMQAAFDMGARLSTHLGNGCHAVLPRHNNYLWEQIANDALMASIIVDGRHLTPAVVRTIYRTKGSARLILISDAVAAAGLPPGRYRTGEVDIEVGDDGSVQLAGTPYLAGSSLKLCDAVNNVMAFAGATFADAIRMAAGNPAALFGLDQERGTLAVGARADLTLFRPVSGGVQLVATIVSGQVCYQA
jgi:N-acetylglucosamine-6-phosphate deacetylase